MTTSLRVRIPSPVRLPYGIMVRMTTYKPYWNTRTYSKEEFIIAWNNSRSIAECGRNLGLTVYGTTYKTLRLTAKSLDLDESHMLGQGWNKPDQKDYLNLGKINKTPIEKLLIDGGGISSSHLKERLLNEGLLKRRCSAPFCKNPSTTIDGWTGEEVPTPLSLDHINGINTDNRLENLRFICANCDRMTPTFCRGGGKRKSKISYAERSGAYLCSCGERKTVKAKTCKKCSIENRTKSSNGFIKKISSNVKNSSNTKQSCICGATKSVGANLCQPCEYTSRKGRLKPNQEKIDWPSDKELKTLVSTSNYRAVGRALGVSDNAVKKRMKNRNILRIEPNK